MISCLMWAIVNLRQLILHGVSCHGQLTPCGASCHIWINCPHMTTDHDQLSYVGNCPLATTDPTRGQLSRAIDPMWNDKPHDQLSYVGNCPLSTTDPTRGQLSRTIDPMWCQLSYMDKLSTHDN